MHSSCLDLANERSREYDKKSVVFWGENRYNADKSGEFAMEDSLGLLPRKLHDGKYRDSPCGRPVRGLISRLVEAPLDAEGGARKCENINSTSLDSLYFLSKYRQCTPPTWAN